MFSDKEEDEEDKQQIDHESMDTTSDVYEFWQDNKNEDSKINCSLIVHKAVGENDEASLRSLLLEGKDPNQVDMFNKKPLYYALKMNNEKTIATLLEFGALANDFYVENYTQVSYIQTACEHNKVEIVKLFLDHGCDVNAELLATGILCSPGARLLHLAVMFKRLEIVKLALSYGADVNLATEEGETPLHAACEVGNVEIVKLLLDNNALVNVKTKNYLTPLYKSVRSENDQVIELLLKSGVQLENENSETIIFFYILLEKAMDLGNTKIIRNFLEVGLDPNVKFFSPKGRQTKALLHSAVSYRRTAIVNLLLEHKADVTVTDNRGQLPIHLAAGDGNLEIMQLLLQYEGKRKFSTVLSVDKEYATPLHLACKAQSKRCVQALIDHKADLSAQTSNGDTPLHLACEHENLDLVKILVESGSPLDLLDIEDNTAAHIAVSTGNHEILELLLMRGASFIIKNKMQRIPLDIAARRNDQKCIELLFKYSKDVNHEYYREIFSEIVKCPTNDDLGLLEAFFRYGFVITPLDNDKVVSLFWAVVNGQVDDVESLIASGVDVNVMIGGETLLHLASFRGCCDVVKTLLRHGADMSIRNQSGKLAIYCAYLNGHLDVIDVFLDGGLLANNPDIWFYPILAFGCFGHDSRNIQSKILEMLRALVSRGADVNYRDKDGRNALHLLLRYLFKRSYWSNGEDQRDLHERIESKDYYFCDACSFRREMIEAADGSIIRVKDSAGMCLFSELVQWGVDVNAKTLVDDEAVIHAAVKVCRPDMRKSYSLILVLLNQPELYLERVNGDGATAMEVANQKALTGLKLIMVEHGAVYQNLEPYRCYPTTTSYDLKCDEEKDLDPYVAARISLSDLISFESVAHYRRSISYLRHLQFAARCERELNSLGRIKIGTTNFKKLLTTKPKDMVGLSRDEEALLRMLRPNEELKFYRTTLFRHLGRAIWRRNLIEAAKETLRCATDCAALPDNCAERVFYELTDLELERLCRTTRPDDAHLNAKYKADVLRFAEMAEDLDWSPLLKHIVPTQKRLDEYIVGEDIPETLTLPSSILCANTVLYEEELTIAQIDESLLRRLNPGRHFCTH